VLAAYEAAGDALLICYGAGIEAWDRVHPDRKPAYTAKQAVAVIIAAKQRSLLRIEWSACRHKEAGANMEDIRAGQVRAGVPGEHLAEVSSTLARQ